MEKEVGKVERIANGDLKSRLQWKDLYKKQARFARQSNHYS
jgi:hypothetical protein